MGCVGGLVRLLLFVTNILFAVGSLALLVVAIIYKSNLDFYEDAIPFNDIQLAPNLAIAVSVIVFVIAFFGCYGAWRKNKTMLIIYGVILVILFILQMALSIYAFVELQDKDKVKEEVNEKLESIFKKYPNNNVREIVDLIQSDLHCCGLENFHFWDTNISGLSSCNEKYYNTGCKGVFYDFIDNAINAVGITAILGCVFELLNAIFAFSIARSY